MSSAYLKQYTCEIIIFRMANSCRKETGHDSNGRRRFQSMNELASRIMFKTDLILNKSIIPGEKNPFEATVTPSNKFGRHWNNMTDSFKRGHAEKEDLMYLCRTIIPV